MSNQSGQINLIEIVGIGMGIIIAGIGGFMVQTYRTDDKIGVVNVEISATKERTAKLEADGIGIKDDLKEIKSDIKLLLKQNAR
jgi:hypothetical protein